MIPKLVLNVCPQTKRKKSNTTNVSTCLFYKEICNEQHTYTQKQWEALRLTAKEWSELDRYGFVYSEVDWEKGTQDEQSFFHRKCSKNMQNQKHAKNRLHVEEINFWNHLHRFVPPGHQTQILSKRLLDHQASPSFQLWQNHQSLLSKNQ